MKHKTNQKLQKISNRDQTGIESPYQRDNRFRKYIPYLTTSIFFILSFIGIINHQMWRDEYQAWIVANNAHSISDLFNNLKYEGNPALWHMFLYLFTSLTNNTVIMKIFHVLISTSFIYLINVKAPFTTFQKILLTFGYFTFFEYNIISRGYGLGFLLVVIFCTIYKERYKYYLLISVILFLLSNSTIFGLIFSGSFTCLLFLDYINNMKKQEVNKKHLLRLILPIIIIIAGWITGLIQIWPSSDNSFPIRYPGEVFEPLRAKEALSRIVTSYFAIPDLTNLHFWNTSFFVKDYYSLNAAIPLLVVILITLGFLRRRLIALLYLVGTSILILFYYYTKLDYDRYTGHLFILLIACFWLASYYEENTYRNKFMAGLINNAGKLSAYLFSLALLVSFMGGLGANYKGFKYPFSTSIDAAKFIRKNNLQNLPIVGYKDYVMSPLSFELNKKIFYPERREFGTFTIWDRKRNGRLNPEQIIPILDSLYINGMKKFLFITNFPLTCNKKNEHTNLLEARITYYLKASQLCTIDAGIEIDEKYNIYLAEKYDQ